MATPHYDRPQTLEFVHEDVVGERDRLRSARAAVTRQLGPLPASAGIVIGLVGSLDHRVGRGFLIIAGALFGLVVLVSVRYSRLAPYRILRGKRVYEGRSVSKCPDDQGETRFCYIGSTVDRSLDHAEWLTRKIALEEHIYGPLREEQRVGLRIRIKQLARPSRNVTNLQDSFDVELLALNLVQGLFACIVIVLLVGIVTN